MIPARIAIITGAGSGIGRATALALANQEAGLILHTGSNTAGLQEVAQLARARGARVETIIGDIAHPDTIEAIIKRAAEPYGRIDILISAAGKAQPGGALELTMAALDQGLCVTTSAFLRLVQGAAPLLKLGVNPRIVAVSSFIAHVFRAELGLFAASAASRAALEAMVKTLARELAADGICVNAVAPGLTLKDRGRSGVLDQEAIARLEATIPLGRRARPEEIAAAILFLASPEASYITGQILHVDGGLT